MKKNIKLIGLLIITILTLPILSRAQQTGGYDLTGHLNGLKDGTKIVMTMMTYQPGAAVEIPKDSAYVKNGEFKITGVVPEGPRVYWMHVNDMHDHILRMFIDNNQHITVRYDEDLLKLKYQLADHFITVEGSPTNNAFHLVERFDNAYDKAVKISDWSLRKLKDSLGFDFTTAKFLVKQREVAANAIGTTIADPGDPEFSQGAALFALYEGDDHSAFWSTIYNQMDEHLQNSVTGKKLKQRLLLLQGETFPIFTLPDANGKAVNLKEIIAKSKVTLVHFWANKSVKRDEYDEELRAMYKQFHDKGLTIIGVSTETKTEKWKDVLATENYPWDNVADPQGIKMVDTVYHELGEVDHQNTTNVLIDKNGKIIAWDPTGILLQYYIVNALKN